MSPARRWAAPALLALLGVTLGLSVVLAKVAARGGVSFLGLAFWQSLGAGLMLAGLDRLRQVNPRRASDVRHVARYGLVGGLVGVAVPQAAIFAAAPHLGAGLASVFYTLTPVTSLAMARALGLSRADRGTVIGLLLGLAGSLALIATGTMITVGSMRWIAVAALAPVSLAVGNVWRTHAWPDGEGPDRLAAVTLLCAAGWLLPFGLATGGLPLPFVDGAETTAVLGLAVLLTALAYAMLLRLQRIAGPVYLSQIGYVVGVTGMMLGAALLGEQVLPTSGIGVALIVLGVAFVRAHAHAPPAVRCEGHR